MVRVEALSNRGLAWLIGFSHLWLESQVKARPNGLRGRCYTVLNELPNECSMLDSVLRLEN